MHRDLTSSQKALEMFMSGISEEAWCAGWVEGLEFALWECVIGRRTEYGMITVTPDQIEQLRRLSAECNGWIVFDDETEETWLPLDEWKVRFERGP